MWRLTRNGTGLLMGLVVLGLTAWGTACRDCSMSATRLQPCASIGQQCDLGHGALGVCFDAPCPPEHKGPCFTCAKQH